MCCTACLSLIVSKDEKNLTKGEVCFLFSSLTAGDCVGFECFCCARLTDGGDEVKEALLWKEGVLQSSEVQLQHPSH